MKKKWNIKINISIIVALLFSMFVPSLNYESASAEKIYTVAELKELSVPKADEGKAIIGTVDGYIVGHTTGSKIVKLESPFGNDLNYAIADSPDEKNVDKMASIQIPSNFRNTFGLSSNPKNVGKKVRLTGKMTEYNSMPGMKTLNAMDFVDDNTENPTPPTQVAPVLASIGSGAVAEGTEVTLSTETENAKIYFTTDGSIPTKSSSVYSTPFTINETTNIKAIAVADNLDNSEVAEFTYTIATIQSIKEVRGLPEGSTALTTGIVTAVIPGANETVYIQDETDGIVIYGPALGLKVGDKVEAIGSLKNYNGLLELVLTKDNVKVLSNDQAPSPVLVTPTEFDSKKSMLVKLENVMVEANVKGSFTAKTSDGTSFTIRPSDPTILKENTTYDTITGVLGYYNDHQLIPRNASDLVEDESKIQDVVATPGAGFIKLGDKVTLQSATKGATIYYTLDGSEPTKSSSKYSEAIEIKESVTIKAFAVKEGLTDGNIMTFAYELQPDNLRIHHIQGAGHNSSFINKGVSDIEGIVTYVVDANNFYMQDLQPDNDPKTSEGILVFISNSGVKIGDVVTATGTVKEYVSEGYDERFTTDLTITEIAASIVTIQKSGQELPKPIVLNPPKEKIDTDEFDEFNPEVDGIDYYESIEGMLATVEKPKVVAPQANGEIIVVPENYDTTTTSGGVKYTVDDANPERIFIKIANRNYKAKTGDFYQDNVTGVISYGYSNFKLLTDEKNLPKLIEGKTPREVTTIEKEEDKLTVASYNVENFSASTADSKVKQLAEAIVTNLKTPDVIGLTEMQDNDGQTDSGTTDASKSFGKLIAKIKELSGTEYSYTDIDPVDKADGGAPGGNIRVGFLYNKERVSLVAGEKGSSTEAVGYKNGKLTKNPGRIQPTDSAFNSSRKPLAAQFEFKGKTVVIVANHFNSKGGDEPLFGKNQPPILKSEVQRHKIATIVNSFVKDIKKDNENENVILLGDFNDFEFSETMDILKGNELANMVDEVPGEERYSYTYQGNSQVLDHILVSNNMKEATSVNIVHINSSFMEAHGRASDHDPVLIQASLEGNASVPNEPKKVYNLIGYKTKKLIVETKNTEVNLDETSEITEGIVVKANAIFKGKGLENTTITIDPTSSGTIIDLSGEKVKEVIINSSNVIEIKGAENVLKWTVANDIDTSGIKFTNSKGEAIASPVIPNGNRAPVVSNKIQNITSKVGEKVTINLVDHFSDPDNDKLTFKSSVGSIENNILTLPTDKIMDYIVSVTVTDSYSKIISTFGFVVSDDQKLETYYEKAEGKTGEDLKDSLHSIIKNQTKLTYDQVWTGIKDTDEDPANPNNVILLYSRKSISKNSNGGNTGQWNREHVWAKSHGDFGTKIGAGTDLHHLRAEDVTVNSKRGHLDFDEGGEIYAGTGNRFDIDSWEPADSVKGDVARMLFYMAVRYEGTNGEPDLEMADSVNTYPKPLHGKLSVLLKWNEEDPVDASEQRRNEIIFEKYQHNRNPFIDHPEWAKSIWGNDKAQKLDKAS